MLKKVLNSQGLKNCDQYTIDNMVKTFVLLTDCVCLLLLLA